MEEKIVTILNKMAEYLTVSQMKWGRILRTIKREITVPMLQLITLGGISLVFYVAGGRRLYLKESNEKDS